MKMKERKGSALLIVLGMLAFMIVSAVAFSAYMRYARLPSSYLRRTTASRELTKAAKNDRRGNYVKNSTNEAGYVYGSAGLRYYLRKKGLPIDQADTVLVRPAMWIKLGAMN